MVSGHENRRDAFALPHLGTCIMRIFEKSAVDALLLEADVIGENTGTHSRNAVGEHHSRELASGENVIAYGYLLIDYFVDDALVYAFVATGDRRLAFDKFKSTFREMTGGLLGGRRDGDK